MSEELHLISNVAVAVGIALTGALLAHLFRQPVIVGYLLAGVASDPFTLGFVGDRGQISALAESGVIFLMFALGIEFSLTELARVRGRRDRHPPVARSPPELQGEDDLPQRHGGTEVRREGTKENQGTRKLF